MCNVSLPNTLYGLWWIGKLNYTLTNWYFVLNVIVNWIGSLGWHVPRYLPIYSICIFSTTFQ